jgi:hypothetical protein
LPVLTPDPASAGPPEPEHHPRVSSLSTPFLMGVLGNSRKKLEAYR